MRKVQQIMGMPISIDIPGCDNTQVFDWAFARLRQIDNKFSTYKPQSEVSLYINSKIEEADLSRELKNIIRACHRAEKLTGGYFSAWASGQFDPSGYVKGWAIAEAGDIIEKTGYGTYCIGAGGDILAKSDSDKVWSIGIQDPNDKTKILNKLSISKGAVATSGNYERGTHIVNPKTNLPANDFMSVTVSGPDIIWADVLATAIFAMGPAGQNYIKSWPSYEAIIISTAT